MLHLRRGASAVGPSAVRPKIRGAAYARRRRRSSSSKNVADTARTPAIATSNVSDGSLPAAELCGGDTAPGVGVIGGMADAVGGRADGENEGLGLVA